MSVFLGYDYGAEQQWSRPPFLIETPVQGVSKCSAHLGPRRREQLYVLSGLKGCNSPDVAEIL